MHWTRIVTTAALLFVLALATLLPLDAGASPLTIPTAAQGGGLGVGRVPNDFCVFGESFPPSPHKSPSPNGCTIADGTTAAEVQGFTDAAGIHGKATIRRSRAGGRHLRGQGRGRRSAHQRHRHPAAVPARLPPGR